MKNIQAELKKGISRLYLLYGDEPYLINKNAEILREAIVGGDTTGMNETVIEGKAAMPDVIANAMNTLPFFNDRRLVILKNTGLFAAGRKDDTEKTTKLIRDIPETTVLVFQENDVDKRLKLFKAAETAGTVFVCGTPSESELVKWIQALSEENGKTIDGATAAYLLRVVNGGMDEVRLELMKLISYSEEKLDKREIDEICTKSPESQVFDLVRAVGNKRPAVAVDILSNLVLLKESPVMVIALIARQLRMLIQCGALLEEKRSAAEISSALGLRDFIAREYIAQCRSFSTEQLRQAIFELLETDYSIKSGRMEDKTAVELWIIKHAG